MKDIERRRMELFYSRPDVRSGNAKSGMSREIVWCAGPSENATLETASQEDVSVAQLDKVDGGRWSTPESGKDFTFGILTLEGHAPFCFAARYGSRDDAPCGRNQNVRPRAALYKRGRCKDPKKPAAKYLISEQQTKDRVAPAEFV